MIDYEGLVDSTTSNDYGVVVKELIGYYTLETDQELSLEYDVLVNFSLIPYNEFNIYKESMPFYRNIVNEGVILSA